MGLRFRSYVTNFISKTKVDNNLQYSIFQEKHTDSKIKRKYNKNLIVKCQW